MTREPAAFAAVEAEIGHRFADRALLQQALTHISAVAAGVGRVASYQRLEFLGDRVLGLVVSAMLYAAFPGAEEGEMSRRLAALVRRETCAEVGRDWQVGPAMILGDGENNAGGRDKAAILSDICEALIGAVFLDGGFAQATAVVEAAWAGRMREPTRPLQDPKTTLQEWAQGRGRPTPLYRETGRSGPAHAPVFTLSVSVEGSPSAIGSGSSKRNAEQAAAQAFLEREGLLPAAAAALVVS